MSYSKGLRRELMKGRTTVRTIRKSMNRQVVARKKAAVTFAEKELARGRLVAFLKAAGDPIGQESTANE